uniref:Saposin B-type domain-containing protein n=1 Tax=Rhabditophanes sp. KR3021 TaxID=114890 RepID=A0AC35TU82_9BILA
MLMKSFIFAILAIIALTYAMPNDLKAKSGGGMKCPICEMLVQDSEEWLGKEGEDREAAVIKMCEKELSSLGVAGKMICDAFVKDELDNLIAHLDSQPDEIKDAKKACKDAGYC